MKDKKENNEPVSLAHIPQNAVESLKEYFEKSWYVLKEKNTKKKADKSDNQGFTLIELAIVIVIIGLLVGGVMKGAELIEQAKIRGHISLINELNTAGILFKDKYNCVAGDCINATTWCADYANGNGDSIIQSGIGTFDTSLFQMYFIGEGTHFLEIINAANFWKKTQNYDCGAIAVAGVNIPASPFGSGVFVTSINGKNGFYWGMSRTYTPCCGAGGNHFRPYTDESTQEGTATVDIALAIDRKIDDGLPRTGKVYSAGIHGGDARLHAVTDHTGGLSCTQGVANVYNPAYLGNETKICKLFFESDF